MPRSLRRGGLRLLLAVLFPLALGAGADRLHAQSPAGSLLSSQLISARRVEAEGVPLDGRWEFRLGDNPSWSLPTYDDSDWTPLDPSRPLPDSVRARVRQLEKSGVPAIGWFRLHIEPERMLIRQPLALQFANRGAAELFLDGRKLRDLGDLDRAGGHAAIEVPLLPIPILFDSASALLAVRYHLGSALDVARSAPDSALFRAGVLPGAAIAGVARAQRFDGALLLGLFGLFLAVGALYFVLYLLLRKPVSNLHYAAFAGHFAVLLLMLYLAHGSGSFRVRTTLELVGGVSCLLGLLALVSFLYTMFYRRIPRAFTVPLVLTVIGLVAVLVVLRPHAGAGSGRVWSRVGFLAILGLAAEAVRVLALAVSRRTEGAAMLAAGLAVTLAGFGYYLLGIFGVVQMAPHALWLVYFSSLGLAFAPSLYLAYGFARTAQGFERLSNELSESNRSLEAKVGERTAALEQQMTRERQRAMEQQALIDTMADLSGQLELARLLDSVLERAVTLMDTAGGELAIVDEARQELVVMANQHMPTSTVGMRLGMHDGAMGHAIRGQKQLMIPDYHAWEGRSAQYEGVDSHAMVVAPLLIGQRPMGAIAVWHHDPERQFSEGDLRLLNMFAQQAAVAIENARLYTEAQEQREYFESVVVNSPVAIVTCDLESRILSANPAFERLFGWTESEIHGRDLDALITDEAMHEEAAAITQAATGETVHRITRRRRKDGEWVDVEVLAVSVFVNGEPRGLVALYHDITDLIRARREAEAADQAKSQFLANMSHELRTPLNAIIGYSEMLIEEAADAADDVYVPDLQKIHTSGRHLLGLINDILDLSKIEAGRMELYLETFEIAAMIDEVANTIRPLIEKNENALALDLAPDLGRARLDQVKVRQILFNLLSNASKFTEHGTISLAAARTGEQVTFRISDTGIGMTAEQMARLFQPFTQADASTTKKYGGTGLGLTITRHFCEMMGGTIEMASEPGQGTSFTVLLPIDAETIRPAQPAGAPREIPLPQGGGGATVLVIDDDPTAREMLARMLAREGYNVRLAASGEDGLRAAREEHPDVITLDVLMAGLDGWGVLSRLKGDAATADIPVVVVTVIDDRNLGFALGAADYLTKPVERDRLADALRRVRADGAAGPVLVVDDDPDVREMLRRTLEKDGWRVVEAENGRVALDRMLDHTPAVVLLDLMMPEMDGFAFLEVVRARGTHAMTPIIVLTAKTLTEDDRQRLKGALRVIQKGESSAADLIEELRRAVHAGRRTAPAGGA